MLKRNAILLSKMLLALSIVLFFAGFGETDRLHTAVANSMMFIHDITSGTHLSADFYGIRLAQVGYSVRLLVVAVVIAVLFGLALAVMAVRIRWRLGIFLVQGVVSVLEAVPDAMYVLITVIIALYCIENLNIALPAFPYAYPSFVDTWIPAIAIALPGAFYLMRTLMLRADDERFAPYVVTALSKGASQRRAFYCHVMPNLLATWVGQIPVVAAMVTSSALFAEFFMGYRGVLNLFPNLVGWNMTYGLMMDSKIRGVPIYQVGAVVLIGSLFVIVWSLFRLLTTLLETIITHESATRYSFHIPRMQKRYLILGIILLTGVLLLYFFPHLVTPNSPSTMHVGYDANFKSAPYFPNHKYLLGTDVFGRDLLAIALSSTLRTLIPAMVITFLTVLVAFAIALVTATTEHPWISRVAEYVTEVLGALPSLFLLFLVMYHRNLQSHYQSWQYIWWVVAFEVGRSGFAFTQTVRSWYQFQFIEGAASVGLRRVTVLFTQLRSWLLRYLVQFGFSQFARTLSLMTQLAAFHIYLVERLGYVQFTNGHILGIVSESPTWFSMIGDAANNYVIISYPFYIYAPLICLLATMVGANFMARAIRGSSL